MTTIAFDGTTMAADSQCSWGHVPLQSPAKIIVTRDVVIGLSGDGDCRELESKLAEVDRPEDVPLVGELRDAHEYLLAIVCFRKLKELWLLQTKDDEGSFFIKVEDKFIAIGTGGDLAMGSMAAGCTAKEAVKLACKHDVGSSPPIRTVKVW